MTQVTISSLRFVAPSPSLLFLVGWPISLIFAQEFGWRVCVRDVPTAGQYASRDEAANALAMAMGVAQ
jgi:hypothetical protein